MNGQQVQLSAKLVWMSDVRGAMIKVEVLCQNCPSETDVYILLPGMKPVEIYATNTSGTYPTTVFDLFYYFDLSALSGSRFVLIIYEIRCHLMRVCEQGSTINRIRCWLEGYFKGVMIDILVDIEGLIDI